MDDAATVIGVVALIGFIVWLFSRSSRASPEAQLRRICLGDTAQAERLIASEMQRSPSLTRAEAADRAVRRYQRDNR